MTTPYEVLRNRMGVSVAVFGDPELDEIWESVANAPNDTDRQYAAMAEMAMRLRNNANKLFNYTAGASSKQLAQVRKHLQETYEEYKPYLERANGTRRRQFVSGEVRQEPRERDMP